MSRIQYMLGNWKMNHNLSDIEIFLENFNVDKNTNVYYGITPQSLHADRILNHKKSSELGLRVGAQNISDQKFGAYTGELSPVSAKDLGLEFTLVGHSERRTIYNESDDTINQKVHQGLSCGLKIVFCIGETLEEREAGNTPDVLKIQLIEGLEGITLDQAKNIVIAYEPVWAIGTGKVASADDANDVHQYIREVLTKDLKLSGTNMSIIYGGSVKPENAVELLSKPHIDGGLVGGASLKGESFAELVKIAERSAYLQ